ncbi:UNC-50 family protein [Abeliophyllum distichum]|uniref:UNC-50 family protein n=1 Tax=Abeliophyllum distichum TaxID=126358 RepID=A0ABD1RQW9_9LAMI
MLPTSSSTKARPGSHAAWPNTFLPQYLRRIVKWQQMDIEYTFWQMLLLCTSPKVVYQHTKYHKQTKNQWARDDPAFVVVCSLLLAISTIAYCAAYDHSAEHAAFVVISVLLFHFFITGAVVAALCWFVTNNYLREEVPESHVVEQRVEWLYAFDVHCNSFLPHVCTALRCTLFSVASSAISYYHYLNFLGYDVLPFLERTTLFLYPIGVVIVLSPILILSGFNPSRYFMNMYFSRLL